MSTAPIEITAPSEYVASRVRVLIAERGITMSELARRLGVGAHWTTKRLGRRRAVDLTLEDTQLIADALDVSLLELLPVTP